MYKISPKMSEEKRLTLKLKRMGLEVTNSSPATPNPPAAYSPAPRQRNAVKRNLNRSFGCDNEDPYTPPKNTKKQNKRITLVINKSAKTCHYKEILNSTVSDSSSDSEQENTPIVMGKRQTRPPVRYNCDSSEKECPQKTVISRPQRVSRAPITYVFDSDESPPKNPKVRELTQATPLKSKLNVEVKTPKTPKSNGSKTPRSTLKKLIRDGVITPSMKSRDRKLIQQSTPLSQARSQLHVSHVPNNLPCREKEYADVFGFLRGKLMDKLGGCMYISGVPGTGKTATVTSVINSLLDLTKSRDVPEFHFVSINGMKLTEPRQAYVEINKQLTGKTVTWEQAHGLLEEKFKKKTKKSKLPIILLVDELDIICTKRQDVVYNLLDWPTNSQTQLIVITIANTMDLPERLLMNRVTSRLGLTRLTFQAYTHKQLQEIVAKRLVGTDSFNPDAVQLVARKVASVSGDARRALDICRRAAEIAELESEDTLVTMSHVNEALNAMMTQPKVRAIKNCSKLEKFVLEAVVAEVERTGIEEVGLCNLYRMLLSIFALNGFKVASLTVVLGAIARLGTCRLLLVDPKCNDLDQRIVLNVSADDVYFALKEY